MNANINSETFARLRAQDDATIVGELQQRRIYVPERVAHAALHGEQNLGDEDALQHPAAPFDEEQSDDGNEVPAAAPAVFFSCVTYFLPECPKRKWNTGQEILLL